MKIAKATAADMDSVVQLAGVLEDVEQGYYPRTPELGSEARIKDEDDEPVRFSSDNPEHLRAFYDRVMRCMHHAPGGLFRVAFGMSAVLNDDNQIVDPNLGHLELHPRILTALARSASEIKADARATTDEVVSAPI